MSKRIERLFTDLGVKQLDFARKIDFTQSYISQILNGSKTNPSPRFYDAVCREFNVNLKWLKTGKGEIYAIPGLVIPSEDAELITKLRLLPKSEQHIIEDIINTFLLKTITGEKDKPVKKNADEATR